jgi:hypothetical protein
MTRTEAAAIRDAATRRIMAERGCTYSIARYHLERERRARRKEIYTVVMATGCTAAAAWYQIKQQEI